MNHFPLDIAYGSSFCNRDKERLQLKKNINAVRHTVIVAPRRYGKSSLAIKTLEENKILYGDVDYFNAFTDELILKRTLKAVEALLARLFPIKNLATSAVKKVSEFLTSVKLGLQFGEAGASVSITPTSENPLDTMLDVLEGLSKLLEKHNKKAVILMDEFQSIASAKNIAVIEALIRSVAQKSKNLTFIFSGSNRHLLTEMFEDRSRPLYKMCDKIHLDRISQQSYEPFLQAAAQESWKNLLDDKIINTILLCTQRHPYYVNRLCAKLWDADEKPTQANVESAWVDILKAEKGGIENDIELLGFNQRMLLNTLAQYKKVKAPTSQQFSVLSQLPSVSAGQAMKALVKKDLVYINSESCYRILDPLMEFYLQLQLERES